ncbi:Exo_endo_phos domain-containing protein/DUF4283 domain-containing protein [Cephalotus follicularis]|uniref:Exo_endo_phos domain-containing protein/DUF4283 domain-containing protein n=1 Tax=Cephalotus follicularis TaxID=3775 RepID=A0A1Q3DIW3_CEPFO|nr:Exo_endo_phos domain-containing protein/DUF4283 domain-containing protein [Cephalotus follicularis]
MPPLQCSFTKVPVWVKLMNIPMEYWTPAGLSQMSSVLGNPLYMDAATKSKQKINFARICVEMSASSKFPVNIRTKRNSGAFMDVKVEYCWKPVVCEQCRVFDHSTRLCLVDRKLALSPASVKGSVLAVKVNAPNDWVKVGNRGKVNMPREGENASMHLSSVLAEADSSKVLAMVDKQKGRVEESPQTVFLDRNPMENNNLEGFVEENSDSLVTKSPGELEAGSGKKKKEKKHPCWPSREDWQKTVMKCTCWNVRGLNDSCKQLEIRNFVRQYDIAILGLLESRVRTVNKTKVARGLLKGWDSATNHHLSLLGRIWIIWDPARVRFKFLSNSFQAIHGLLSFNDNSEVFISFIYGDCDRMARRELWGDMRRVACKFSSLPWAILGDFNVSRSV